MNEYEKIFNEIDYNFPCEDALVKGCSLSSIDDFAEWLSMFNEKEQLEKLYDERFNGVRRGGIDDNLRNISDEMLRYQFTQIKKIYNYKYGH